MLGKWTFKLIKYAVVAAIAIVMGSQLISSATGMAVLLRMGNIVPTLAIGLVTVVLLRVSSMLDSSSRIVSLLLETLAWASTVYLVMVVLLGTLYLGLIASITMSGGTVLLCSYVRNPKALNEKARIALLSVTTATNLGSFAGRDRASLLWSWVERRGFRVLILPLESLNNIMALLRDRPLLPISLTRLKSCYALVVLEGDNWVERVISLLDEVGIGEVREATKLLTMSVLGLPILDEELDMGIDDYFLVLEEKTVNLLLQNLPVRATVHPRANGPVIVTRRESIAGLDSKELPKGMEVTTVLLRDISNIEGKDEQNGT